MPESCLNNEDVASAAVWPEQDKLVAALELRLDSIVDHDAIPAKAAHYSLTSPGKRLRALITLAAVVQSGGAATSAAIDVACAVEMIHAASLIIDDLPAMDDADTRRGQSTAHRAFGEGVAILAGIGLLNSAFSATSRCEGLSAEQRVKLINLFTDAVGWRGLVGGQALDLAAEAQSASPGLVNRIHYGKTGALFVGAACAGGILADADARRMEQFLSFGQSLGYAYQALDDLLDHLGDPTAAGKPTNSDTGKVTAITALSSMGRGAADKVRTQALSYLASARASIDWDDSEAQTNPLGRIVDQITLHFDHLTAEHL